MTVIAQQRARNLGSNYTVFRYRGQSIAYLEGVQDSGQEPVGSGFEVIHPLGFDHPTEIVVANAIGAGSLTLAIREMWRQEVWQQLAGLANTTDIVEVFRAIARSANPISCTKIVQPPTGARYGHTYHNCVIVRVPDGEQYDITTLSVTKAMTIMYTHKTPL